METASVREVQHNLAAYLRKVAQGEVVTIRCRSRVVARLVPAAEFGGPETVSWAGMEAWRRDVWGNGVASGMPVHQIVSESRGER